MVQSKKHALGAILTISPLIRRVSIYLLLSAIAVASINLIGVNQEGAYKIYLPLFIAIYIISRWIDSRFTQLQAINKPHHKKSEADDTKGFATGRSQNPSK